MKANLVLFYSPMQYSELREYPKVPAYYSDVYRPQIPPPRENWGGISGKF